MTQFDIPHDNIELRVEGDQAVISGTRYVGQGENDYKSYKIPLDCANGHNIGEWIKISLKRVKASNIETEAQKILSETTKELEEFRRLKEKYGDL